MIGIPFLAGGSEIASCPGSLGFCTFRSSFFITHSTDPFRRLVFQIAMVVLYSTVIRVVLQQKRLDLKVDLVNVFRLMLTNFLWSKRAQSSQCRHLPILVGKTSSTALQQTLSAPSIPDSNRSPTVSSSRSSTCTRSTAWNAVRTAILTFSVSYWYLIRPTPSPLILPAYH